MIKLHHVPQTRSMRSLWLLHELGIEFDLQVYSFDQAIKSPEYLALNGAGRVPTLEIDGEAVFESGAIAQVLCERFSPDDLGRSVGNPERAQWLNWIHFAETVSSHTANLTQQHIMLFEDHMRSPIVMKLEAKRLAKTFGVLDAALASQNYLLAGGFSAADIGVGQAVYMGQHFVKLDDFTNLARWFAAISEREAFKASLEGGNALYAKPFYEPWPVVKP